MSSTKNAEFLDHTSNYQILTNGLVPLCFSVICKNVTKLVVYYSKTTNITARQSYLKSRRTLETRLITPVVQCVCKAAGLIQCRLSSDHEVCIRKPNSQHSDVLAKIHKAKQHIT
jgi:hypothetical protein